MAKEKLDFPSDIFLPITTETITSIYKIRDKNNATLVLIKNQSNLKLKEDNPFQPTV